MSRMNIYRLVILAGCLLSCEEPEKDYIERRSPVGSFTVIDRSSSGVTFDAEAWWENSCGKFSRATVDRFDSVYVIQVFGREPNNSTCLAAMTPFHAGISLSGIVPGRYIFKFWRSDSTTIDTTFVFP